MPLIPRDEKFYDLFCEQAENIHDAAEKLLALFEEFRDVEKRVMEIKFVEHKGDQLTHALMMKLNRRPLSLLSIAKTSIRWVPPSTTCSISWMRSPAV